ncbi:hypothetical protein IMZ48_21350 [Candidatus Bathyarchaeota archaeon]|nr:hypothetical protein [Candidatus Bathyarchaeota archaeon]
MLSAVSSRQEEFRPPRREYPSTSIADCSVLGRWEHTPEWSYTSKLLISKHQQVQLLEAASVLVTMNNMASGDEMDAEDAPPNVVTPPDSTRGVFPSDGESASPTASGYSEMNERQSSADTTPPPHPEGFAHHMPEYISKRYNGGGISYQSTPASAFAGSAPNSASAGFGHARQPSQDRRPPSSGKNATGQDDSELAAAVELLSCSFNSNGVRVPHDAPPVPPLPAQYLDQAASLSSPGFLSSFPSRQPESFTRGETRTIDTRMEDNADSGVEDEEEHHVRARSDEDDDGVFGRMVL